MPRLLLVLAVMVVGCAHATAEELGGNTTSVVQMPYWERLANAPDCIDMCSGEHLVEMCVEIEPGYISSYSCDGNDCVAIHRPPSPRVSWTIVEPY